MRIALVFLLLRCVAFSQSDGTFDLRKPENREPGKYALMYREEFVKLLDEWVDSCANDSALFFSYYAVPAPAGPQLKWVGRLYPGWDIKCDTLKYARPRDPNNIPRLIEFIKRRWK